MKKTKQQQLDEIKQQILDDKVCPELAEGATQLVFGDGNPDAKLVFIGEAPGKNEDLQGVPFVGAAGKFLDEMLGMIDLKREDIYITNIVKYRPPNNRDPYPDEKKAFLPYLQSQLEAIQPKVVVTLGRHGLNCFLPDLQISQVHGQPKRIRLMFKGQDSGVGGHGKGATQGAGEQRTAAVRKSTAQEAAQPATPQSAFSVVILPLFHPAAALYNGAMRQTLIDDFALIPTIIKKIPSK
ncbi:MAG TPA: uracil-DNA glycosylase [Verrucomicrobiae bacterium]|jgi:uracil-DNA glycosylase family 4|nr:uracil-DNA glycosylase [Verrucomicrobiae bacterium]